MSRSNRVFAIVVIAIALVLAIAATLMPPEKLANIIYVSRFFDVMLPVLAVGALIKYVVKGGCCCKTNCGPKV